MVHQSERTASDLPTLEAVTLRVAAEVEAERDTARRTMGSFIGTILAMTAVASGSLFEGAQAILGDASPTLTFSLLALAVGIWCINTALFHRGDTSNAFYRHTQGLELLAMKLLYVGMIVSSSVEISVLWAAMPITALFWAWLRPTRWRESVGLGVFAHVLAIAVFALAGRRLGVAVAVASMLAFVLLVGSVARAQLASFRLRARQALADEAFERLRLVQLRENHEQELHARVGTELEAIAAQFDGSEDLAPEALAKASEALSEIKDAVWALGERYAPVNAQALAAAVRKKCAPLLTQDGFTCDLLVGSESGQLPLRQNPTLAIDTSVPSHISMAALRFCQEMTRNAVRHGQASAVIVQLVLMPNSDEELRLLVRVGDDGHGLCPQALERSRGGLKNATERAHELGGTVRLISDPDEIALLPGSTANNTCLEASYLLRPARTAQLKRGA